jgi:hypothetical protein
VTTRVLRTATKTLEHEVLVLLALSGGKLFCFVVTRYRVFIERDSGYGKI